MQSVESKEITKIIMEFVATITSLKIYPQAHPQVIFLIDRLFDSISRVFNAVPEFTLFIVGDNIVAYGKPLLNTGPAGQTFVDILNKIGVERITLLPGLPKSQLIHFVNDLADGKLESIPSRSHIKLGKIVFDGLLEKRNGSADEFTEILFFQYMAAQELQALYSGIQKNESLDSIRAKKLVVEFIRIFKKFMDPLKLLASIKSDDEYTYVHVTNVALLTVSFADFLGFYGKTLEDIGVSALLHDVGKMVIPDEILNKPGPLTSYERAIMETHTIRGAQYIGQQKNVPNLTILTALEHHIKFNGTGYPKIKKNWQPNIISQMIIVADIYDALRSKRPYSEPMSQNKAIDIIRKDSGSIFNPTLVENFFGMLGV